MCECVCMWYVYVCGVCVSIRVCDKLESQETQTPLFSPKGVSFRVLLTKGKLAIRTLRHKVVFFDLLH